MAHEVELKLELDAVGAERLSASAMLGDGFTDIEQRSIYFDTPDQSLSKAGFTLRIRRTGRKRIQTVKASGGASAGLFARSEWEKPVRNDTPLLDDTTPVKDMLGPAVENLAPVFQVHTSRRRWDVPEGEALIEVVLDRGDVVRDERTSPVCEIELELKSGPAAALFTLARKLHAVTRLKLGVLTKSERGYSLIGPARTAFKAEPVSLDPHMTVLDAFRQIAQACIRQFLLNERHIVSASDPRALHQARVALRRLRSAFTIFKSVVNDDMAIRLQSDLRWLAAELGDARNLDVLSDRIGDGPFHDRIETARVQAYADATAALASERARILMLDLAEWLDSGTRLTMANPAGDCDRSIRDFASSALDRFRRKVKKGGHDLRTADDEMRHDVRKDAKKLRYAAEFFASLFDEKQEKRRYKQFINALEVLQDQLGLLNDLATAPHALEKIGIALDPDVAALLGGNDKKKLLLKDTQKALDRLVATAIFWD